MTDLTELTNSELSARAAKAAGYEAREWDYLLPDFCGSVDLALTLVEDDYTFRMFRIDEWGADEPLWQAECQASTPGVAINPARAIVLAFLDWKKVEGTPAR